MKARDDLTAEYVRSILAYEPSSGELRWVKTIASRAIAGEIAGSVEKDGCRRIRIKGRTYPAARLIWLIMTGEWPPHDVDHRDLDKGNDRWRNLRPATSSQNHFNIGLTKRNSTGFKGVSRSRGLYLAELRANGKHFHLGRHKTAEQAARAYRDAAAREHGEFARFE